MLYVKFSMPERRLIRMMGISFLAAYVLAVMACVVLKFTTPILARAPLAAEFRQARQSHPGVESAIGALQVGQRPKTLP